MADTTIYGTGSTLNSSGTYSSNAAANAAFRASNESSSSSSSKSASSLQSLNENFDQFLGMLTTQMKNQDPLNPMDSNQMTSQLVQFSMAEQAIGTNSRLDKLVAMQEQGSMANNLIYLNRIVQFKGNEFDYVEGAESGVLAYELDSSAKSVNIEISNEAGRVVRTIKGETSAGTKHDFTWDFTDDAGAFVDPGKYSFKVIPKGESDSDYIGYTAYTYAGVSGVDFDTDGDPVLKSGDRSIPIDSVTSVY